MPNIIFVFIPLFFSLAVASTSPHPLRESLFSFLSPPACILWLNDQGAVGCNQAEATIEAPLRYFSANDPETFLKQLADPSAPAAPWAVIIEPSMFADRSILRALSRTSNVAGVAVAFSPVSPAAFSPASKFSDKSCSNQEFSWNPAGSELLDSAFNYTVVQLNSSETSLLLQLAHANQARGVFDGCSSCARNVLQLRYHMYASGSSSSSCLESGSCQPIGGFSPWAAIGSGPEFVVLTAAFDSAAMFQDLSQGSLSSSAGVAVVLAVAEAFATVADSLSQKTLVVLLAQADAWSRSGSARWWSSLQAPSCPLSQRDTVKLTNGELYEICKAPYRMNPRSYERLSRGAVTSILEVQQPGLFSQPEMFLHVGCNSSAEVARAAELLASAANVSIVSGTPVPPSSVRHVFRAQNTAYPSPVHNSFVLAGFEHKFTSSYFHSQYDSSNLISMSSLCNSVQTVVKATSHLLGVPVPPTPCACFFVSFMTFIFQVLKRKSSALINTHLCFFLF